MFAGTHTAIVTPFRNGQIDEAALKSIIDFQFDNGVSGIVPCGTTGESPTLDHEEHSRVVKLTVEYAKGRGVVMAGTGSNSTREAVELTQEAEAAGATAILQVAPYYNKPTPEGLYQHFKAVAESTKLPIMLYSIPGRCGIEIGLDVLVRLTKSCPNICGDDGLTLPFMSVGAVGIVSVAGNLIPKPLSEMVQLALKGDYTAALKIHAKYYPLFAAFLKLATNPIPIKTAMALAGHCTDELRLPLVGMEQDKIDELSATLKKLGIIS